MRYHSRRPPPPQLKRGGERCDCRRGPARRASPWQWRCRLQLVERVPCRRRSEKPPAARHVKRHLRGAPLLLEAGLALTPRQRRRRGEAASSSPHAPMPKTSYPTPGEVASGVHAGRTLEAEARASLARGQEQVDAAASGLRRAEVSPCGGSCALDPGAGYATSRSGAAHRLDYPAPGWGTATGCISVNAEEAPPVAVPRTRAPPEIRRRSGPLD